MALKPILSVSTVGTTESSGNKQNETDINCSIFTYGNNSESESAYSLSDEYTRSEFEYLRKKKENGIELTDIEEEQYYNILFNSESADLSMTIDEKRHNENEFFYKNDKTLKYVEAYSELDYSNLGDADKRKDDCLKELTKSILAELGSDVDISTMSKDDMIALCYTYNTIRRAAQEDMQKEGVESVDEYIKNLSDDEINQLLAKGREMLAQYAPNTANDYSSGRKNANRAADASVENEKYYEDMLAFVNSEKIKGIDYENIKDTETLKNSDDLSYIEYNYLKDKKAKNGLSETEEQRLDTLQKQVDNYGDIRGIRHVSGGDGSYLAEFKTSKYRVSNISQNGEKFDEKLLEDVINKMAKDFENLSSEECRKKILEIMATAKDEDEGELLTKAFAELQKRGLISAETFYTAFEKVDQSQKTTSITIAECGSDELIALYLEKELKNDKSTLTAQQFAWLWDKCSDKIKQQFSEQYGTKITELLDTAKKETIERESISNSDNSQGTARNSQSSDSTTQNPTFDMSHSEDSTLKHGTGEKENIFARFNTGEHQILPNASEIVADTKNKNTFGNEYIRIKTSSGTQYLTVEEVKQAITASSNREEIHQLFEYLPDDKKLEMVINHPRYLIYLWNNKILFKRAKDEIIWKIGGGNRSLQTEYEYAKKELKMQDEQDSVHTENYA